MGLLSNRAPIRLTGRKGMTVSSLGDMITEHVISRPFRFSEKPQNISAVLCWGMIIFKKKSRGGFRFQILPRGFSLTEQVFSQANSLNRVTNYCRLLQKKEMYFFLFVFIPMMCNNILSAITLHA